MDTSEFFDLVNRTESSVYFDEVIGHIQDIVLSAEFQELHQQFFEKHWHHFDYDEENKIEYISIYESYQYFFEKYLTDKLSLSMPHFDMERFDLELNKQRRCHNLVNCEIIELIDTITDFQKFKEEMLDYRTLKEGRLDYIESSDILITRSYGPSGAG